MPFYAVSFWCQGVVRVVVLHADDEQDALYRIRENWPVLHDVQVDRIDTVPDGIIRTLYEKEERS